MPHPVSPLIMSVHVSPVAALSNYQSHSRNPSHSHAHPHPDPLLDTIPSSPHTMSLHTQAHTPISPRAWPVGNILDDLEKWQIEEESELIAIDADRDEMEHAKTKEESSNKDKEKSQATTPRRISRLFRAISPRTSPATSPSPSPSSSSPHLIPVKHSAIVPISAVAPIATATATPPLLLSPTASPARSLSSTPQPSPRQSPQPSPQPSPSTTPRAPLDGRPPTPRRSIHRTLKSPRMYLDEYHYLQHNPISPVMKILDRDYQIVDTAVTQVPIKPVKPIKKKEKKHRHVPSSAPSSPCQTPTRPPSSSHSKTPPPRSFSARSSRGAISMLPSDTDVRPRSHPLPSPITLPRQTISEPSPIHAPALPTFHPTDLPSTPKLPPIPEFTSRIAPPLPSLPTSKQPPPVPTWTRRESAIPSMPSIQESLPELKQVYTKRSEDEIISIISVEREKPKPKLQPLRKGESSLAATIAAINRAAKVS